MAKKLKIASKAHPVTRYALDVISGKITAGPYVRAECERHIKYLSDEKLRKLFFFDEKAADRACDFFPDVLRLKDGQFAGKPFNLEPSQVFIVGSVFGWKKIDPELPRQKWPRRFDRVYIEQGKGNGKTPMSAGVGLFGLVADGEVNAEIYAAASSMEQAQICFNDAAEMTEVSALAEFVDRRGGKEAKKLVFLGTGSFFKPLSGNMRKGKSGLRPHFALCDEIHEHPNNDTIEVLERGFKWRLQPLLWMSTNSGSDRTSVCFEEHDNGVQVCSGKRVAHNIFTYICALDPGDDPLKDKSCWIKANPLLGVTIQEDYLQSQVDQAIAIPSRANRILRWHFCVWTGANEAWIDPALWRACEDPTLDIKKYRNKRCWGGLDLGSLMDITAKALVFEDGMTKDGKRKFVAFVKCYTPEGTLEDRELRDKIPYTAWVQSGDLIANPGKKMRFDQVASDIVEDSMHYVLEYVAYDKYLVGAFQDALDDSGGAHVDLVEHPQGHVKRKTGPIELWMPGSIDTIETYLIEERIRICPSPVLTMAAEGAVFRENITGLRCFDKRQANVRIDALVALTMACGAAEIDGTASSPWEDPDYDFEEEYGLVQSQADRDAREHSTNT